MAALASVIEIKSFHSWGQVERLWESGVDPFSILLHPHMPRYLIVYPGFLLEDHLPGLGFSIYISIFFALNILLLYKVAMLVIKLQPSLFVYLIFVALHYFMNGRGVIVWTAWLICIWVCHKISIRNLHPSSQIGWIAISCLLATVSTGVFIVTVLAFSFFILRRFQLKRYISITRCLIISPVGGLLGFILINYFFISAEKNLEYYGGGIDGIFNMLTHGAGIIFFDANDMEAANYILILLCLFMIIITFIFTRHFSLLDYFVILSIVGGLFGFTVLTMLLPPLLLRIQNALHLINLRYKQHYRNG